MVGKQMPSGKDKQSLRGRDGNPDSCEMSVEVIAYPDFLSLVVGGSPVWL